MTTPEMPAPQQERKDPFLLLSLEAREVVFSTFYTMLQDLTTKEMETGHIPGMHQQGKLNSFPDEVKRNEELRSYCVHQIFPLFERQLTPLEMIDVGIIDDITIEQLQEMTSQLEREWTMLPPDAPEENISQKAKYESGSKRIQKKYLYFTWYNQEIKQKGNVDSNSIWMPMLLLSQDTDADLNACMELLRSSQ